MAKNSDPCSFYKQTFFGLTATSEMPLNPDNLNINAMKTNINAIDKTIRLLLSIIITILILMGWIYGLWAVIGSIASIYLTITSFIGYCAFYNLFRITTRRDLNSKAYYLNRHHGSH